jgi:hypothetical protein
MQDQVFYSNIEAAIEYLAEEKKLPKALVEKILFAIRALIPIRVPKVRGHFREAHVMDVNISRSHYDLARMEG